MCVQTHRSAASFSAPHGPGHPQRDLSARLRGLCVEGDMAVPQGTKPDGEEESWWW